MLKRKYSEKTSNTSMYLGSGRFSIRVRRNMKRWGVHNLQQKFLVNIKSYLREVRELKENTYNFTVLITMTDIIQKQELTGITLIWK